MSEPSAEHVPAGSERPPSLCWRSWPVRDDAVRGPAAVIALLIVGVAVGWLSGEAYLGLLALVALVVALWRLFLPVVFELSALGVDQRLFGQSRRIPWQAVRRYEIRSAGVLLLPDEGRSGLAPLRGLYLPWASHRDEVLAHVRHYLMEREESQEFAAGPRRE